MLFRVTFDMDGVLADTRTAVQQAYSAAGMELPPGAWGKPATAWQRGPMDRLQHQFKQALYPAMLKQYATPLYGATALHILRGKGFRVGVVTNASSRSAMDVLDWLGLEVDGLLCGNKDFHLSVLQPSVHVDDDPVSACVTIPFVDGPELLDTIESYL